MRNPNHCSRTMGYDLTINYISLFIISSNQGNRHDEDEPGTRWKIIPPFFWTRNQLLQMKFGLSSTT